MKLAAQTQPASARCDVRRSARAFTILEVMISTMVMVLVLTSSLQVLGYGLRMIDSARYTTLAGQILQSQMEKLRLLNWTQLTNTTVTSPQTIPLGAKYYTTFTADPGLISSTQVSNFYLCTQSIVPDPNYANMMDITLRAYWKGSDGMNRSRTYFTTYAKNGTSDFFYTQNKQ
jgi:type II secretory pathway pseudopilin PulG